MTVVIGVDVGGTKTAIGPVDAAGRLVAEPIQVPTVTTNTEAFITGMTASLRRAIETHQAHEPAVIGLACAGTIDAARRTVVSSPNLPLKRVPLADILSASMGMPVILENDVNAALLAESTVGVARGVDHVVMLALGTGVGGALLLDGRLYRGSGGGAGELGHIIVCGGGEPCRCGARGCLEMYASGRALVRYAESRAGSEIDDPDYRLNNLLIDDRLDGKAVGLLVEEGYPGALAAAHELAVWLGRGLVCLTNIFNPEMIVVGGGVSDLGDAILAPARRYMRAHAMPPNREQAGVVQAGLGNSAGLVGAALIAWKACPSPGMV